MLRIEKGSMEFNGVMCLLIGGILGAFFVLLYYAGTGYQLEQLTKSKDELDKSLTKLTAEHKTMCSELETYKKFFNGKSITDFTGIVANLQCELGTAQNEIYRLRDLIKKHVDSGIELTKGLNFSCTKK